jgi:hypothetical protein
MLLLMLGLPWLVGLFVCKFLFKLEIRWSHNHYSTGTNNEATHKTVSKRHIYLINNSNIPITLI